MDIQIRRIRPSDSEALGRFYAELSPESLHARFLGYARGITGTTSRSFCTLDHMHDEGFVAIAGEGSANEVIGHLCLASVGPHQLDLGIAVADGQQGRGIGRRLFQTALLWARDHHFTSVVASCYADNSRVLALLASTPTALVTSSGSGVVEVVIPLELPLPRAISIYVGPDGKRLVSASPHLRRRVSLKPRGVWRRTQRPARDAAGSAWRESS